MVLRLGKHSLASKGNRMLKQGTKGLGRIRKQAGHLARKGVNYAAKAAASETGKTVAHVATTAALAAMMA